MSFVPADVRVEWPRIKAAVAEACGTYPPEEVYHACRTGEAHLYVCEDGFVVLKGYKRHDSGTDEVLILLAWGQGQDSLVITRLPEIEEIARKSGAKTLAYRRLKDSPWHTNGWRMRATEYEKEL